MNKKIQAKEHKKMNSNNPFLIFSCSWKKNRQKKIVIRKYFGGAKESANAVFSQFSVKATITN